MWDTRYNNLKKESGLKKNTLPYYFLFLFSFLTFAFKADAAKLYWVDGSGTWNDANHWSVTSGGRGGAGVPGMNDDVVFDGNSFSVPHETVTIPSVATCRNMNWETDVYYPTLNGSPSSSLEIYGSLSLIPELNWNFTGTLYFKASSNGNIISTYGRMLPCNVYFDGKGSWQLTSFLLLAPTSTLTIASGSLHASGNVMQCGTLTITGIERKLLDINKSTLFIKKQIDSASYSNFVISTSKATIYYKDDNGTDNYHSLGSPMYHRRHNIVNPVDTVVTRPNCSCKDSGNCCNGKAVIAKDSSAGNPGRPFTYLWSTGATVDSVFGICASLGVISVKITDTTDFSNETIIINMSVPQLNIPNETTKPPKCNGQCNGWIVADINGEMPNYTYVWNSGIGKPGSGTVGANVNFIDSALCAGTYTLTVRSKGTKCENSFTFPLVQPKVVAVTIVSTNISCDSSCNGTATASASGGHPGVYKYSWAPGGKTTTTITGLCAGTYTCNVHDDSNCIGMATVIITEPPPIAIAVAQTNEKCSGDKIGTINLTVTGGTPAYTYTWTPAVSVGANATGLSAGAYKIVVKDAQGCKDSVTVTITQPPLLTASITSSVNVSCNAGSDGSITVKAAGGTPAYTYSWSPSGGSGATASNLTAGCYTVTITDANNCTATASACITQPAAMRDSISSQTNIKCFGFKTGKATVGVKGGTPPYTYSWAPSGQTTASITGLSAGCYTVTVKDANACTATAVACITQPTQLTANITTQVNVACNGNNTGSATVTAGGGTPAYTYAWAPSGGSGITASNLTAGCYTVTVTDANGCTATAVACITQPANPLKVTLSAVPNPLKCNGDADAIISSTVSGGTAAYVYLWSPGGQTSASITGQSAGTYKVVVTDAHGCKDSSTIIITQPGQIRDSVIAITNVKCNGGSGGSAKVGIKGGTPGYTYLWSPGGQTTNPAVGLSAGTYTLTITDKNGCTATISVTITQPPPIILTMSNTGEKCNGNINGTATVSASGGTPGYNYVWAPGGSTKTTISNLSVGCYTVTVTDANGCTATASTCITQPLPLTAVISSTTSSCGKCDGSAVVTASGGTSPYTYNWNPTGQTTDTAKGLCVGTYTVTVTDANGCSATAKVTIVPTVNIILTTNGSSVSCFGFCDGIASANPSGGVAPYTYSWAPGGQTTQNATGLCAGSYTVTVTDADGCSGIDSTTITDPPKLTVATIQTNVTCVGKCNGSATATPGGGTGAYTYTWAPGGQTTSTINALCVGIYTITVTDANGCNVTAAVNITSGGSFIANPSITQPACNISDGIITVAPTGGTAPYTYLWAPGGKTTATITGLSAGTYTVTITDAAGCNQQFFILLNNTSGPTLLASSVGTTCADACNGSATCTVTAGSGPFTYLWSNGATTSTINALCPGVYACSVKDNNGCITNISDTVKKPVPINPNPSVQNINCNTGLPTGKITLATVGGTGPYTYLWAPAVSTSSSASNLSAGTYTITVTDNVACDTVINVIVTEPPVLTVTITSTNVSCNGAKDGSATGIVSGGTAPYIYNWSNGAVTPTDVNLDALCYTLTVTDANGCISTASVCITQPPPLSDVITPTQVSCNGGANGGATSNPSGGTAPYTFLWSNGNTTNTISGVSSATYYLTITDAHGCTYDDSVKITQPPPIVITFTVFNDPCNGSCNGTATANVIGGTPPYTYNWSNGQTTDPATNLCAGSYIVTVTDANGCTSNNSVTITQPTAISANPTATATSCSMACDGTASAAPTGGTGAYTYNWLPGGQTTSTVTGLCPGNYSVVVTDKNGCVDTGLITVPKPPALTIVATTAASNCGVSDGSITISAGGGSPGYVYLWTPGGQTTTTITGLSAGIYQVKVTDSKGCDSTFNVLLNNTGGVSSFTNTQQNELCFGDSSGYIVAVPIGGTMPYAYFWANLPPPNGQGTDSIYQLTAGTYTLEVTDNAGCLQFDTVTVIQPPALSGVAAITKATCSGICTGAITFTAGGGTPPYAYSWSNGSTSSTLTALCPGNYTDTLTDKDGCRLVQTFTVGASIGILVTTTQTNILCNGNSSGTATANAAGGAPPYTYNWTPGPQTNQTATGLSAGTYTIVVSDKNGCQGTDSATITQPAVLAIVMNVTPVACNGDCNGKIVANVSGGTLPYTYNWSPNGSTASTIDSITNLCSGTYPLTVTDANGCTTTASVILVNPLVFTETHIITNATCNNTPDGAITLVVGGGTTPYTYSWNPSVSTNSSASNLSSGTYTVTISDSTGCVIIDSIAVLADTTVTAKAGNDTCICIGALGTITLNGSASVNSITYAWFQLPGMVPIGNTVSVTIPDPAVTTSYVLVTANGSCTSQDTITVCVAPLPVVDAGPTKSIFIYFSTTIGGAPTGPAGSTYRWDPPKGLSDTAIANPTASPTVTTTYTVTVTGPGGCATTDTVTVIVLPQIVIPDGFTPNGDGQNDVWDIKNISEFPGAVVEVFNRWGEQLFYSAGYATPWNGMYDNKALPVGTYYYIVDLHDPRFPKAYTGPVTIMR